VCTYDDEALGRIGAVAPDQCAVEALEHLHDVGPIVSLHASCTLKGSISLQGPPTQVVVYQGYPVGAARRAKYTPGLRCRVIGIDNLNGICKIDVILFQPFVQLAFHVSAAIVLIPDEALPMWVPLQQLKLQPSSRWL